MQMELKVFRLQPNLTKEFFMSFKLFSILRSVFFSFALLGAFSVKAYSDHASPIYSGSSSSSYSDVNATLEAKAGYFFFSDSKMSKVYNEGGWDVQVSGSCPIWKWLEVYGSVEYLEKHGKSLGEHESTSIWEIPLSFGLKPVISICQNVQYYFTLGPRYFFVYQHNDSSYVSKNLSNNGLGLFVNTGFNFIFWRHLLVDVFGEYSYKQMHFHSHKNNVYGKTVNVGGFVFGGGLGYAF